MEINHSQPCNLLDPQSRTTFIIDFIALVRYVADGHSNVGQLRRPGTVIHRAVRPEDNGIPDEIGKPPQAALDDHELANWLRDSAELYGS